MAYGTIHHDYCPDCGNYTVDRNDGYCHMAGCDYSKEVPPQYEPKCVYCGQPICEDTEFICFPCQDMLAEYQEKLNYRSID